MKKPSTRKAAGKPRAGRKVPDEVRRAVERGGDIHEAVRTITLKALTRGELDGDSVRKVAGEVMKGVRAAATARGAQAGDATEKAVRGLDEALAHAAQALKLSVEEAAGRAEKFSRKDLAKARGNLESLEKLFLDTLRATSRASRGAFSSILDDLVRHARTSGTAVGRELAQSVSGLSGSVAQAGRAQFEAGVKAALSSGAMMARIASGVLAGIADSLSGKAGRRPG
jgi:hypothetical protein